MFRKAIFLLLSIVCLHAREVSWPGVKYAEVRAYAWPNNLNPERVILADMKLEKGVINPSGALLTAEQTKTLLTSVTGQRPGYPVGMCHVPHNAIVFYDADKKPVAFVEVCFGCSTSRILPAGAVASIDLVAIAGIFDAHKLPMGKYSKAAAFKKDFDARIKELNELIDRPSVPSNGEDPFQ